MYEYKRLYCYFKDAEPQLNDLAKDGWRVVYSLASEENWNFILERGGPSFNVSVDDLDGRIVAVVKRAQAGRLL